MRLATKALIKISERLSAKTVITGAKITLKTLARLKCSLSLPVNLSHHPKASIKTRNGEVTITARKNATLKIKTTASAIKGKNNQIQNPILISISQLISPNEVSESVFAISVKLSNDEYIVT
ncbi:hypothetical protein KKG31_04235, partial [Patescibacteria group bacterium]|nr:hypothetical protein [Patescibacteria group bacterium]